MKREDDDIWQPSLWTDPLNWLIEWFYNKPQQWRYWWKFRHNPAPGPDHQPVLDARGRTYWLWRGSGGVNDIAAWRLYYRGERVGQANALRFSDEEDMSIGDLEVDPDHRGRELGAILLRHIEAEAKQQGALGVTGRVVAKDVAAFPRLPAWYEEQGYNVQPIVAEPSKGGTYDVARIWKAVVQA